MSAFCSIAPLPSIQSPQDPTLLAKKSVVYLFSVLMIWGAVFMLCISGFQLFENYNSSQRFQETTATIIQVNANDDPSGVRGNVFIRFEVKGVEYGSELPYIRGMRVGDGVRVFYHSDVPLLALSAEQYRGMTLPSFVQFLLGGILLFVGVMLIRRAKDL
jgi:hypothetical protein